MGLADGIFFGFFALLVGIGVGLPLATNTTSGEFWFARICFLLASADFAGLAVYWLWNSERGSLAMRLILGGVIGALILPSTIGALHWLDGRQYPNGESPTLPTPLSFKQVFDTDFSALWSFPSTYEFISQKHGTELRTYIRLLADFDGKSAFVAFFIPHNANQLSVYTTALLLSGSQGIIEQYVKNQYKVGLESSGTSRTWVSQLTFSGRIFLYHEDDLSKDQEAALYDAFKSHNLSVEFRGQQYFMQHRNDVRALGKSYKGKAPIKIDIYP